MDIFYVPLAILMSCKYLFDVNIIQLLCYFIINGVYLLKEIGYGLIEYVININKFHNHVCVDNNVGIISSSIDLNHETDNPNLNPNLVYIHDNYCNTMLQGNKNRIDRISSIIDKEETSNINRQCDMRQEIDDLNLSQSEKDYDAIHMKQNAGIQDDFCELADSDDDDDRISHTQINNKYRKYREYRDVTINQDKPKKDISVKTHLPPTNDTAISSTDKILQKISNNLSSMLDDKRNEKERKMQFYMIMYNAYLTAITSGSFTIKTIINTMITEIRKDLQDDDFMMKNILDKLEQFLKSSQVLEHVDFAQLWKNDDLHDIDNLRSVDYYESKQFEAPKIPPNLTEESDIEMNDLLDKLVSTNPKETDEKCDRKYINMKAGTNKISLLKCSDNEIESVVLTMLPISSEECRKITLTKTAIGRYPANVITYNVPPNGTIDLTNSKKMLVLYRDGYTRLSITVPGSAVIDVRKVTPNTPVNSDDSYDIIDEDL